MLVGENWREKGRGAPTGLLWTATKSLRLSEEIICGPLFGGPAAVSNTTVAVRCLHWHSLQLFSLEIKLRIYSVFCIRNCYGLGFSVLAGGDPYIDDHGDRN